MKTLIIATILAATSFSALSNNIVLGKVGSLDQELTNVTVDSYAAGMSSFSLLTPNENGVQLALYTGFQFASGDQTLTNGSVSLKETITSLSVSAAPALMYTKNQLTAYGFVGGAFTHKKYEGELKKNGYNSLTLEDDDNSFGLTMGVGGFYKIDKDLLIGFEYKETKGEYDMLQGEDVTDKAILLTLGKQF